MTQLSFTTILISHYFLRVINAIKSCDFLIRKEITQLANFSKNSSAKKSKLAFLIMTQLSFTTILISQYFLEVFFLTKY